MLAFVLLSEITKAWLLYLGLFFIAPLVQTITLSFNGGGTPEQSGYIYYGHLAAADMARRAGDNTAASRHDVIAAKIKKAVNDLLWMPERGQYASYVEPWGHKRQMPDAWIYAQHVPIEAGLSSAAASSSPTAPRSPPGHAADPPHHALAAAAPHHQS